MERFPIVSYCSRVLLAFLLSAGAGAFGQSVTGVITGTVKDPAGAIIPNAQVVLINEQTNARQSSTTNDSGVFVFSSVQPGSYGLEIANAGFRTFQMKNLVVTANERRSAGDIVLRVGQVQEQVEVTAEVTPVQTSSSERAGVVTTTQLMNTAIKGRDFVSLLSTLPGIVDMNSNSRAVSKGPGASGLHINGGRDTSINFSIEGIQDTDTGSNGGSHNQPNMDAVAEVKVLTSNYQAEYGRNSGGTINVILKSGTQNFHGSSFWFYRHESLFANDFFRNRTGTSRPIERINNAGYTVGGPVYIPGVYNKNKDKLFFFFSQEFVRRQNYPGTRFITTPTALERAGDFSQTFDVNGALIAVKDPLTGQQFSGNVIPKNRINSLGQTILNFFPLPNYQEADPALRYTRNYRSNLSGSFPRRQDLVRLDYNFSSTLMTYFRYIRDNDDENWPYGSWVSGSLNYGLTNTYRPQRGRGAALHITKTFSASTVNEFTMGASNRSQTFNPVEPEKVARSTMGNIGQWYPAANESHAIPNISFGGVQNPITPSLGNIPYTNRNPVFSWIDNLSKVIGTHTLKLGLYVERMRKDEVGGSNTRGSFDFGRNTNNPFDTNYAFANALLGNFYSYSEATFRPYSHYRYTQTEWYAQDNWKVSNRLSLEYGLRFYNAPAAHDDRFNLTTFDPALYNPATAAVLIRPGFDAAGKRVGVDPRTGQIYPVPYIGLFVPGSGSYAPGMVIGGKNYAEGLYSTPPVSVAPRLGFAYDPAGNGKTAVRGGFGIFYDRPQGNVYSSTQGQQPVAYTPTTYFGSLDNFLQASGAVGPSSVTVIEPGQHPLPTTMNYSFSVQRDIGFASVIDVAYVGSAGRHLLMQRNINPIPMFARFDPANVDSTTKSPLPDNFLRPYSGLGDINMRSFGATSNYHSLQVSLNRRMSHGLQYSLAYTYSKSLGVGSADFDGTSVYFPLRSRNYGPLSFDIPHAFVVNYTWEVPDPGKHFNSRPLTWILGNWQLSGITSVMAGTPVTPGFSTSDGADITGSTEGARIDVVGDPNLPSGERTFQRNFNAAAFARPARGTFGNAGVGILRQPGYSNWDVSVSKRLPIGRDDQRYFQLRGEFYNAFNHTQFSSIDTTARFDATGKQINQNFGAFTATRDPRKVQLSLRFMF
ncbi:MAG TPA: carboxypeptidase regulatory-like domain-containing protein [Bryobacteraceae bacterium]|nr:carboxypeptidase regulatory-like domain-containing protein [Bryobacteraceae bacterium]